MRKKQPVARKQKSRMVISLPHAPGDCKLAEDKGARRRKKLARRETKRGRGWRLDGKRRGRQTRGEGADSSGKMSVCLTWWLLNSTGFACKPEVTLLHTT
jgi:hypothetical protein